MSPSLLEQAVPYRLMPRQHPLVAQSLMQKDLLFDLVKRYGSPLNIIYPQIFRQKYQLFKETLASEHLQHRLYVTCKPNRSDALLREAARANAYVDVSSLGELLAAREAGIPADHISATGPKNKAYLNAILDQKTLSSVDNWAELDYLETHATAPQEILIRLSAPQTGGAVQDDTFGFHIDDVPALLTTLKHSKQLIFVGFACHYSGSFDKTRFRHIDQALKATLHAFDQGLSPRALNIGGGYQVGYVKSNQDWQNFMTALKRAVLGEAPPVTWDNAGMGLRLQNGNLTGSASFMDHYQSTPGEIHLEQILAHEFECLDQASLLNFMRDSGLELYVEPGRALMDQAGITLAEVTFTKKSAQGNLLVNLDMNHSNLNAHAFKYMAEPILLHQRQDLPANKEGVFYYGSLCFASDLITFQKTYPDHLPESGDLAAFINTAGYRMDFAESTMLRHPTADKICLLCDEGIWTALPDESYLHETAK